MEWNDVLSLHDRAVADYAAEAALVQQWLDRPAPQKWSPAEITAHLILAFEAVLREIAGGPSMQLRTTALQRFALRWTILRRIQRGGRFPNGAPAPRETRPGEVEPDAQTAIGRFQTLAGELTTRLSEARLSQPELRLVHPYFGHMKPADALYVSSRHIDHHRGQLRQGKSHAPARSAEAR